MGVAQDGTIYVANLTTQSTTSPYRVYSWANNGATPTVAYSGNGGLAGARLGGRLAVLGARGWGTASPSSAAVLPLCWPPVTTALRSSRATTAMRSLVPPPAPQPRSASPAPRPTPAIFVWASPSPTPAMCWEPPGAACIVT